MPNITGIDHIGIAVADLEQVLRWVEKLPEFDLIERRTTLTPSSGMVSAVVRLGCVTIVFVQGTDEQSHVSEFVRRHGPGIQHVALRVREIDTVLEHSGASGLQFATPVLDDIGISQIFSKRDESTGLMLEFIRRSEDVPFSEKNVQRLFESMESGGHY